jgi:hypothetical protein
VRVRVSAKGGQKWQKGLKPVVKGPVYVTFVVVRLEQNGKQPKAGANKLGNVLTFARDGCGSLRRKPGRLACVLPIVAIFYPNKLCSERRTARS